LSINDHNLQPVAKAGGLVLAVHFMAAIPSLRSEKEGSDQDLEILQLKSTHL
jgi:hypothetical protein